MTDTANLEDGFYWVRFGEWQIAEKDSKSAERAAQWFLTGCEFPVQQKILDEIDPRPIKRAGMERPQ